MTAKYVKLRDILSEMVPDSMPQPVLPPLPPPPTVVGYGVIKMTLFTPLLSTLQFVPVGRPLTITLYMNGKKFKKLTKKYIRRDAAAKKRANTSGVGKINNYCEDIYIPPYNNTH